MEASVIVLAKVLEHGLAAWVLWLHRHDLKLRVQRLEVRVFGRSSEEPTPDAKP